MRILHFVHNFPPEFRGGTESYVLNLSLRQARCGHRVHVVSGSAREDSEKDRALELWGTIRVTRLFKQESDGSYGVRPHFPRISREVQKIMRESNPDVVHVHHWHHLTDDLVRLAVADRFPVIVTLHDFFPVCPRFFRSKPGATAICPSEQSPAECYTCIRDEHAPWPAELVSELYQRRKDLCGEVKAAAYVYTFSETVAEFYRNIPWFPFLPVHSHPIGLLRPLAQGEAKENPGPLRIATWGGQTAVKGTHLLLEAACSQELLGKVEVHVLGRVVDEGYRRRLLDLSKRCGAVLHGYFPESEKETLGRRFDLAVFPTQAFETYSIVVDEALAMGLPVVTTRPGAQSERVGAAGQIVPAGDVVALAKAIGAFLDFEYRQKAAFTASRIPVGTMDNHWMTLREAYGELAAKSGRRGARSGPSFRFTSIHPGRIGEAGGSGRGRPPCLPGRSYASHPLGGTSGLPALRSGRRVRPLG